MTEVRWHVAAASVQGSSHLRTAAPCQDDHAVEFAMNETVSILVLADGAGSTKYGGQGAKVACQMISRALVQQLDSSLQPGQLERIHVLQAMEDALDVIRKEAEDLLTDEREFACTLLGAVLGPNESAFFQVGDGAIVVRLHGEAEYRPIFEPDHGEWANETTFLTGNGLYSRCKFDTRGLVADALLFSDGIERLVLLPGNTAHQAWFNGMMRVARIRGRPGHDRALSNQITEYLASHEVCLHTDDDKTLIVAWAGSNIGPEPTE